MDASQWAQQIGGFAKAMEEITTPNSNIINNPTNNNNSNNNGTREVERRATKKEQNVNCPRCNSTNTKFCYYNNYSLTQPRYFCKTCRRYWTQGGSLRNVPVGGGSRKNKRSSSSSSSSSPIIASSSSSLAPSSSIPDLNPLPHHFSQNPKFLQGQDLNLAFPIQGIFHPMDHHHDHNQFPKIEINNNSNSSNRNENTGNISTTTTTTTTTSTPLSALELLRTGIASRGTHFSSYLPMPMDSNNIYHSSSGLIPNLQEFKLGDTNMLGSGAPNNDGARLLFPFADMNKLASPTTTATSTHHHDQIDDQSKSGNDHHHDHNQGPTGYWTGMLGGGAW